MSIRAHIRARVARRLVGALFLILLPQLLSGCGKSSEQTALDDKIVSQRAAAAAQAELDADQEKFRRMAVGELQAPAVARAVRESSPTVAARSLEIASKERPAAVGAAPAAATASAAPPPRSAEHVFGEVAPSVARIQVMDVSGHVIALGSGVVIDKAVVLTNCHVAKRGVKLTVKVGDAVMPATIQLADEEFDLCRLTVPGLVAPVVAIGSVASLRTGQRVYAIGAPAGLELTISEGIVSALRKVDEGTVIQTTAPISPGSSGGGLFDASGAMVGIVTFQHRFGQNLNFALPADWIGQMRARRASEATLHASLSGNPSDASSALILGQWICRDWVSGRTSQYTFEPDGTVSIAMSEGHVGTLNYRISGKTLQVSDAKQTRTTKIEELTSGKMVLHGPDQSIACER
jgi:serine protease Do